jgi:hypothetical protein
MATLAGKFVNDSGVTELEGALVTDAPISADLVNGVGINNTPSGAGESLVTSDASNAAWGTLGITDADVNSGAANASEVLTADGAGAASWELVTEAGIDSGAATALTVLTADGAGATSWETLSVRFGGAPPVGAPVAGELPLAFDTTGVTGGLYWWDGANWVKGSNIP